MTKALVHQLFEAQVAGAGRPRGRRFGRSAHASHARRRADQLAHRLQSLGVGPECMVGLSTDRSLAMSWGCWDPQSGRRVCAARSQLPEGTARLHGQDAGVTAPQTRHGRAPPSIETAAPVVSLDGVFDEPATASFRRDVASHHRVRHLHV